MMNWTKLVWDLKKYINFCKGELENIEAKYRFSLLQGFNEEDNFWYELKITEISERIRSWLDSALLYVLHKQNNLTDNQKRAIYFKKEYQESFKNDINHNMGKEFHNYILCKDQWWVIEWIIDDTNSSKHESFLIQINNIVGKVLVVHDDSTVRAVVPYQSVCISWDTRSRLEYMNISCWFKSGNFVINPDSDIQIIWDIDLNNWVIPRVSWWKYFVQEKALIRMEIKWNNTSIPGNTFYSDYYKYLLDVLQNIHSFLEKNT